MATIRDLPVELLTIVFFFFANMVKEEETYFEESTFTRFKGSITSPMMLLKVCRQWRHVAMSLPALWSSIYINQPQIPRHFELARFWLHLSRNEPLFLTLRCTTGPEFVQSSSIILRVFIQQMYRWKSIDFRLPFPSFAILNFIQAPLPILEHAGVYTEEQTGRTHEGVKRILNCVYTSPRLRSAIWASGVMNGSPMFFPQTLQRLTNLGLIARLTCVHDVFVILRACPHLRVFTVNPAKCDRTSCPAVTPTVHACLHTLRMRSIGQDLAELFYFLTLPALQSLEMGLDKQPSQAFTPQLLGSLERSRCRLKVFKFRSHARAGLSEGELGTLLTSASLQSVKELALWQEEITGTVINLFHLGSPNQLMPKLVNLELTKCAAQDQVLGNMLLSRRYGYQGFRQLEQVTIGQKSPKRKLINDYDREIFKKCVSKGMKGRLSYSRPDYENESLRPF